ncbi:MAG: prepilin peptidase [Armatimonadota bacterium]
MIQWQPDWVLWAFLFILGATVGSFLNVVIYRLPRAESVAYPPSHCFSCGTRLTVIDLFPVLSYVWLRGRCRHCGKGFSPRYALVEVTCGLLAVACVFYFGLSLYALAIWIICLCLIAVFFVDLDYMIIPDEFVAMIAVLGLGLDGYQLAVRRGATAITYQEWLGPNALTVYLPRSVVGMLVGAGLLLFLGWAFEKIMGKPSMGGGDVKLAGAMGTLLGPGYLFLSYFLLAVISGALIGVLVMALKLRGRRDYIPFGPMLAAAGIVMLLWGDTVAPWVIGRFTG